MTPRRHTHLSLADEPARPETDRDLAGRRLVRAEKTHVSDQNHSRRPEAVADYDQFGAMSGASEGTRPSRYWR
jgi:hypothetical protein